MSRPSNTRTRWGVIGAGEGGARITSQFFARSKNPGIEDRLLVMNSARADLRNMIDNIRPHLSEDFDDNDLWGHNALQFGDPLGAGNFFANGRAYAEEDFVKIINRIGDMMPDTDAFLFITTLGGGTGCGSVPYIIKRFKNDIPSDHATPWMEDSIHTTLAVWPYEIEGKQRHFNAITGLSRLLKYPDGQQVGDQNADMVLLASNSRIASLFDENDTEDIVMTSNMGFTPRNPTDYDKINLGITSAIDMMIGPGREARGVIDIADYVENPSWKGVYHFTPCIATGMDSNIYPLSDMIQKAAENTFVPLDISTVQSAFAAVYAPEDMVRRNDITQRDVFSAVAEWQDDNDLALSRQSSLIPKEERGSKIDILLLLGGFDLEPLIEASVPKFEKEWERLNLGENQSPGAGELTDGEVQTIRNNLEEYMDHQEAQR